MQRRNILIIFSLIIAIITICTIDKYAGQTSIYILFTITSNVVLYFGFRKNAIFFDTFIGLFTWIGFWFKTTVILLFLDGRFSVDKSLFYGLPEQFDKGLIVTSCAFIALILSSLIREKYIFNYPNNELENSSLFLFYRFHRVKIIIFYIILFLFIGFTNYYFHIYQRGGISPTNIPFIVSGIYKWLLLFGLSSFAALILKYEFSLKNTHLFFVPLLTLIESAITNISLLSRGMMLNSSALGFGLIRFSYINKLKIKMKYWIFIIVMMIIIFIVSISFANKLRSYSFEHIKQQHTISETIKNIDVVKNTKGIAHLFVGRSVGLEGVFSISAHKNLSWSIFLQALDEKFNEHKTSFYDDFIHSNYKNSKDRNYHLVSMPGFIAFFYYPGSLLFLSFSIFIIGVFASSIEFLAYRFTKNNQIFSALIAQVIAYRFIHFGYVPAQSYLLFGTIFLNIFLIYGLDKFLSIWYKQEVVDGKK